MVLKDTDIGRLIMEHSSIEKTAGSKECKAPNIEEAKKISSGLAKIAGMPYKEEVYNSVRDIMKIASETIGELAESFESNQTKTLELEKAAEVRSLVDEMIKGGNIDDFNAEEKIAELMGKNKHQLAVTKEAMELSKEGNVFDEAGDNTESSTMEKKGMFDGVIPN